MKLCRDIVISFFLILNGLTIPRPRIECLKFFKFFWRCVIRNVKTYRQASFP